MRCKTTSEEPQPQVVIEFRPGQKVIVLSAPDIRDRYVTLTAAIKTDQENKLKEEMSAAVMSEEPMLQYNRM